MVVAVGKLRHVGNGWKDALGESSRAVTGSDASVDKSTRGLAEGWA